MPYRFLEHTGDVLFEASGESFERALESAAQALFDTIAKSEKVKAEKTVKIEEGAGTLEELVVFTLSALLSESDISEVYFREFKVDRFEKKGGHYWLEGRAFGAQMSRALARTSVKAVTHHLLKVEEDEKGVRIRVLLDI